MSGLCWYMERDDCWELFHFPTADAAEQDHVDKVRAEYGFPWSRAGVLDVVYPAHAEQCPKECVAWVCAECGTDNHRYVGERSSCACCGLEVREDGAEVPEWVPALPVARYTDNDDEETA